MRQREPVALDRRFGVGELLALSARLWLANLPVFFVLALVVVAPAMLLVDGLWAGTLDEAGSPSGWAEAGWFVSEVLVVPALVTAMHVVAVVDLAEGRRPSITRSVRRALAQAPWLLAIVLLYLLAVVVGVIAFVLPGIWLAVLLYFGAQVRMLEGRTVAGSLGRSSEVVWGRWWRALGVQVLITVPVFALSEGSAQVIELLPEGPVVAAAFIATSALVRSYTALAGTLLFFDLRARADASLPASS